MAFTNGVAGKDYKIFVNLKENFENGLVNNYYNVTNMFQHENKHYSDYKNFGHKKYIATLQNIREQNAINYQMEHSSWENTSQSFKDGIFKYGIKNGMNLKKNKNPKTHRIQE